MMNQQECPDADERVGATLSTSYGEIAKLTSLLNAQVAQFAESINGMVESIPSQDSLAEIYKEHSKKCNENEPSGNKRVLESELQSIQTDECIIHSVDEVTFI